MNTLNSTHQKIRSKFEQKSGFDGVNFEVRDRPTGQVLVIQLANPTERFYNILEDSISEGDFSTDDGLLATLAKKSSRDLLHSAEGRLLLKILSESLNISRESFKEGFFTRYIDSVSGAEQQITAASNHIVFGRRGAGKTSLLLYAFHKREQNEQPSIWIDMQVYNQRSDTAMAADVIYEIMDQARKLDAYTSFNHALIEKLKMYKDESPSEEDLRRILPDIRRGFTNLTTTNRDLFIFLDDFHVIAPEPQPLLLSLLYSLARGSSIFLKISAIETLLRSWDSSSRQGLQVPHDAQMIKLDYNLTIPDRATNHIRSILDAHAGYCALPSIRILCTNNDVISRLVWVTAGVPRDALNLFSQAMSKATVDGRRKVTVTDINSVASEALSGKQQELDTDVSGDAEALRQLLLRIQEFCVQEQRKNAFLIEISADDTLRRIRQLVDLRLLHVINEGITVREAGRKYLALILDYGFYTGIRAARSVDLFNKQTKKVPYKDLRGLPIFREV